jgi:hypothetical protein
MTSAFESDTVLFHSDYFLAISDVLVRQRNQPKFSKKELKAELKKAQELLQHETFDKSKTKQNELAKLIIHNLKKHGAKAFGNLCLYKHINSYSKNQVRFVLNNMIKDGVVLTNAKKTLSEEYCPRHTKFWIEGYQRNKSVE